MTIYLYVKTHNKTGLKYLGQTKKKDPHKYKGSGLDWNQHLRIFGVDFKTEIIKECKSKEELNYWGRYFSLLWNVVSAVDDFGNKIWSNRIPETGGGSGISKIKDIESHRKKMKEISNNPAIKLKKRESQKIVFSTPEHKQIRSDAQLVAQNNPEVVKKRSETMKWLQNLPEEKAKRSDKNCYRYDHTIRTFIHESGLKETCTQRELVQKYNLQQQNVSKVVNGRRPTHKGWKIHKE
jgi:hypothetical protein